MPLIISPFCLQEYQAVNRTAGKPSNKRSKMVVLNLKYDYRLLD